MSTFQSLLLLAAVLLAAAALLCWLGWRASDAESKALIRRLTKLPLRAKLRMAGQLATDKRIPLSVRGIPVALVIYLAMPIDILPDFIPVLGQLDDLLIVVASVVLLARLTPRPVLTEHIEALEAAYA